MNLSECKTIEQVKKFIKEKNETILKSSSQLDAILKDVEIEINYIIDDVADYMILINRCVEDITRGNGKLLQLNKIKNDFLRNL